VVTQLNLSLGKSKIVRWKDIGGLWKTTKHPSGLGKKKGIYLFTLEIFHFVIQGMTMGKKKRKAQVAGPPS